MNRCLRPLLLQFSVVHLIFCLGLMAGPLHVLAQSQTGVHLPQRIPPISAKAQRGTLRITMPPEVLLNGQPARLAPGARIRNRNNLIAVSGALMGEDLPVRYTRDPLGLVFEVWVLSAAEAAADPLPPSYSSPPAN